MRRLIQTTRVYQRFHDVCGMRWRRAWRVRRYQGMSRYWLGVEPPQKIVGRVCLLHPFVIGWVSVGHYRFEVDPRPEHRGVSRR